MNILMKTLKAIQESISNINEDDKLNATIILTKAKEELFDFIMNNDLEDVIEMPEDFKNDLTDN